MYLILLLHEIDDSGFDRQGYDVV